MADKAELDVQFGILLVRDFPEGTVFSNPAYQIANVVGTRHDLLKYHAAKSPPFACGAHGKHVGWLGYMFTKTGACEPTCAHAGCDRRR